MEPQAESLPVTGERPFIPDIPVSIIDDPRSKSVLKGSLNKLVTDVAPGARLEDDAAEVRSHRIFTLFLNMQISSSFTLRMTF